MAGLRSRALSLLSAGGGSALARACWRKQARILAYHGVDSIQDPDLNFDGFQVPPEVFVEQLDHLSRHYQVRPLEEIVAALAGECALVERAVAITFDDGYRNNAAVAAPMLKERGVPATFFVTTGFIEGTHAPWWYRLRGALPRATCGELAWRGQTWRGLRELAARRDAAVEWEAVLKSLPAVERERELSLLEKGLGAQAEASPYPFLSWKEVRALAEDGFAVAAHTVSHPSLAVELPDVVVTEVRDSIARVRRETGQAAGVFAYPYGRAQDLGPTAGTALREAGCRAAVTTTSTLVPREPDLLRLPRLNVTGRHRGAGFAALVSGLRDCFP